jgi:hypothetical protein
MKETSTGPKEMSLVEHLWPPEQGDWSFADRLKLPDDGYR